MLTALLLIPIIGTLVILPISEETKSTQIKQIGLTRSLLNFILSIIIWGEFDSSSLQYQFVQEFNTLDFCHLHIVLKSQLHIQKQFH